MRNSPRLGLAAALAAAISVLSAAPTSHLLAQEVARDGTGVIEGRVYDDETGDPLSSVSVLVEGSRLGTITDASGSYRIVGLAPGVYRVRAMRIGYRESGVEEVSVREGGTVSVDFALRIQPVPLPPLTAVAGAPASRAERLEAAVETRAEASQANAEVSGKTAQDFNAANAWDALRIVPGVSYLWSAGSRHGQPTRIRGASTWGIADVIEDFPSLRQQTAGEDGGMTAELGTTIPAVAIQGIEVKKGSLGVLYSGNADGGVIVHRLKRGRPGPPTGTLWLEANPTAEQLLMGDMGGGTETFDYYIAGKLLNGSYDEVRDAAARTLTDDDFHSGLARIGVNPGEDMRLEVLALAGRDRTRYTRLAEDDPATPDLDESELAPNEFEARKTNAFYGVTFDHGLGERTSYELGYSYNRNYTYTVSVTDDRTLRDLPHQTHSVFGNLYLTRPLSDGIAYSAQLGFESVSHNQRTSTASADKDQHFRDRSAFYANTFSFGRRLFLNAGLRYVDTQDDWAAHDILVYNAGLSYRVPGLESNARLAYSTGYSRNEGFAWFFGPIAEAGGVELSENRTLEFGIDQPIPVLGRGRVSVTVFRTMNERVPTFSGWGAETVYYQDREVRGVELAADQTFSDLIRVFGSFAYLDTEIVATTHPEGIQVGNTAVPVPRYTGALGLEVVPAERLRLSAIGTYDDGMRQERLDPETGEWRITHNEPYTRVNLAADYLLADWATARFRIENVLDRTDLGYSNETFGPDGYQYNETVATDPGRFASLGIVIRY